MQFISHKAGTLRNITYTYYLKRMLRVLPGYGLGLVLSVVAAAVGTRVSGGAHIIYQHWFAGCPRLLWMNLLFWNNRGIPTGCGVPYWSLAINFQFYTAFPLALWVLQPRRKGFPARFLSLAAVAMAGSVAFRLWSVHTAPGVPYPVAFSLEVPAAMNR